MTRNDVAWIERIVPLLEGPVLELGVGYGGNTCRQIIEAAGLRYFGTDVKKTPAVDFVANFEKAEDLAVFGPAAPFGSVLVLNVLEHTFDPISILDAAVSLVKPGGKCVVLTPAIWPIHDYPIDVWRPLPSFYEEYAKRRGLTLDADTFEYVGYGPVRNFPNGPESRYTFPKPLGGTGALYRWSRVIHKVFNTFGRGMAYPSHVAIGAVLVKDHRAP